MGARSYIVLAKPGIILGNVLTTVSGFCLASQNGFKFSLLCWTLLGLSLVIASACICNNYIDRKIDAQMTRTKKRPLVTGEISGKKALWYAAGLGVLSVLVLGKFTNLLTLGIAWTGFFLYVFVYSFVKHRSHHATLIGSFGGAVPPVVGYAAAAGRLDFGAAVIFSIVLLWQMPHFFAIAIFRMKEYAAAGVPVLPITHGMEKTKWQMAFYTAALIPVLCLPTWLQMTGIAYLVVALTLGVIWLGIAWEGFFAENDAIWARKMFLYSLMMITVLSGMLCLDRV